MASTRFLVISLDDMSITPLMLSEEDKVGDVLNRLDGGRFLYYYDGYETILLDSRLEIGTILEPRYDQILLLSSYEKQELELTLLERSHDKDITILPVTTGFNIYPLLLDLDADIQDIKEALLFFYKIEPQIKVLYGTGSEIKTKELGEGLLTDYLPIRDQTLIILDQ